MRVARPDLLASRTSPSWSPATGGGGADGGGGAEGAPSPAVIAGSGDGSGADDVTVASAPSGDFADAATISLKSCGEVATRIADSIVIRPAWRCWRRCWSNVCIP